MGARKKVDGTTGIYCYCNKTGEATYYITFGKSGYIFAGGTLSGALLAREELVEKSVGEREAKRFSRLFGYLFKQFIELKELSTPSQARAMSYALDKHFTGWKNISVSSISSADISNIIHRCDLSDGSKDRLLSHLRSFYSHLISRGIVEDNPAIHVRIKGAHHIRERFLSLNEVWSIIGCCDDNGWFDAKAQVLLGTEMGLRKSEMWTSPYQQKTLGKDMGLRWENINFSGMQIRLKRKGGKIHVLPMTERVASSLEKLGPKKSGPVFLRDHHLQIFDVIKKLGLNDGLDYSNQEDRLRWVGIHTLRHTFGTYLAQESKDLLLTSRMMNHSFTATTIRYAHMIDANALAASNKLSEMYDAR